MFVSHYKPLKLKSNQLAHTFMRVGWLTLEGKFQRLFSCSCSLRGCSRGTPPILAAPACVTEPRSWRAGECEPCACVSEWGSFQIHPHLEQSKNQRNTADLRSAEVPETDWFRLTASTHLHEEPSQQSSFEVVGVALGSEGGLRDGKLNPVQGVGQLWPDGLSRLQGRVIQEIVLAPLFCTDVRNTQRKRASAELRHALNSKRSSVTRINRSDEVRQVSCTIKPPRFGDSWQWKS